MRALIAALLLATAPAAARTPFAEREALRRQFLEHRHPLRSDAGRGKPDDAGLYDLQHLLIEIDTPRAGLPDAARFTLEVRVTEATDEAVLPLAAVLFTPLAIEVAGQPADFQRLPDEALLLIALPEPPTADATLVVTMDVALELDCSDPTTCVTAGPLRHLVGLGWFPLSAEFPTTDRFNVALTFRGPDEVGVAATGAHRPIERGPDGVIHRFETERPTILPAFVIGDFTQRPFDARIELFTPLAAPLDGDDLGGVAVGAISVYEALFGPYPFSRLGLSPMSSEAGVALGPQANILLPDLFWSGGPDDPFLWPIVAQTTAHEIGHQYFYNLVGVLDEGEAWMSEAFAEYAATRYWEEISGTQDQMRTNAWSYLYEVPSLDDAPVHSQAVESSPHYFPIVYQKGSNVLNMLRWHLGSERFDAAMLAYVADFTEQVTTTVEFREALERLTGDDLRLFFAQWVDRPGYPTLTVRSEPARRDGDAVALTIVQRSDWGRFEGELPVELELDDARLVDGRAPLEGAVQLPGEGVARVRIDPALTVLRRVIPAQRGDVDLSGVVDGKDLIDVWFAQGRAQPEPDFDDQLDVTDDGEIDQADYRAVRDAFGEGW